MRRCVAPLLALTMTSMIALADEIHLSGGTVIRCRVERVTNSGIFYRDIRPAGKGAGPGPGGEERETLRSISRELAEMIVYDSGETLTLREPAGPDRIFLYDGRVLQGKVVHMADRYLVYRAPGEKVDLVINGSVVRKVLFSDDTEQIVDGARDRDSGGKNQAEPGERRGMVWPVSTTPYRISIELMTGRKWLDPVWKVRRSALPSATPFFSYVESIRHYRIESAQEVGLGFRVRLCGSLWLEGDFSHALFRTGFTDAAYNPMGQYVAEGTYRELLGSLVLAYYFCSRFGLFAGARYFGYYQTAEGTWVSGSNVFPLKEGSFFHSGGALTGFEYNQPLFRYLGIHCRALGGILFGKESLEEDTFIRPIFLADVDYSTALFADILVGPQVPVPPLHTTVTFGFTYRYLYYTRYNRYRYSSDRDEHNYGVRCSLRYTY
ncbi:MAG: hypothetical protein JXA20_13090 [Spirochaetes bacterium]|nr:hypothetical protein [Spirochaetota bacterium]